MNGKNRVTRTMEAQASGEVALVARRRIAQANGVWGMVLFMCAEATLFGTLLATYFYLDFNSPRWPPAGIKAPSVVLPLIATAGLVTTSIPMALASRFSQRGEGRRAASIIAFALLIQIGYLAAQILLFRHDLREFSPQDTAYGSIYFTMLAAHHAHVLLGILISGWVLWRVALGGLNGYRQIGVRALAIYWHVVNVIAIFVVLTQLSPSL